MKRFLLGIALGLGLSAQTAVAAHASSTLVTGYTIQGRTASGVWTQSGVAACSWWIRLGTAIHIDGLGFYRCWDRYASWLSPRVDVWVPTVRQAYALTGYYPWEWA